MTPTVVRVVMGPVGAHWMVGNPTKLQVETVNVVLGVPVASAMIPENVMFPGLFPTLSTPLVFGSTVASPLALDTVK